MGTNPLQHIAQSGPVTVEVTGATASGKTILIYELERLVHQVPELKSTHTVDNVGREILVIERKEGYPDDY